MWKKLALGVFALLFALGSNMDLCCRVWVNGCEMPGLYSPFAVDKSRTVASAAAEEIVSGPAASPAVSRRLALSLHPAEGDGRVLSDAALRSVTGVKLAQGVFINGVFLGCVADGPDLFSRLRGFIESQMPSAAVFGNISGEVKVRPIYSRTNQEVDYEDMVLLISGMAPVIYTDKNGKLV